MAFCVGGLLLLLLPECLVASTLVFPRLTDVMPCNDTPENCAQMYYDNQSDDQDDLGDTANSATNVATASATLLSTVQSLAAQSKNLTSVIDPTNTIYSGGRIVMGAGGPQVQGVTPYMATLSKSVTTEVGTRISDLSGLMTQLGNALVRATNVLSSTQGSVNAQISATSQAIQNSISTASANMANYIIAADGKMKNSAVSFDQSLGGTPSTASSSLANAVTLEANDFNTTMTKLNALYNQSANLPNQLQTYIQTSLQKLSDYLTAAKNNANGLATNTSLSFGDMATSAANTMSAKIQALTSTTPTAAYYNASLDEYMNKQETVLMNQINAENATQQTKINQLSDTLTPLAKSINASFQNILNGINVLINQFNSSDTTFQTAAQNALNDANATYAKASGTFKNFTTNMNNLWNTTGSILTGQTTVITANLLNQIGNMTQDAGNEVNRLNSIMLEASSGALATDAVRQAVLADSRQQIYSTIGNNAAALNSSFASINQFLNQSSSEIQLINNIVNLLSGNQTKLLNDTTSASLAGLYNQMNIVSNSSQQIVGSLIQNVKDDIATDNNATILSLSKVSSSFGAMVNQTQSLIAAMKAVNNATFTNLTSQINSTAFLVNKAANDTTNLGLMVAGISSNNSAYQKSKLATLQSVVSNATIRLQSIMQGATSSQADVQNKMQSAVTNMTSNQTALVQNMTNTFSSVSSQFSANMVNATSQLNSLMASVGANTSLAQSIMESLESDLSNAKLNISNAYKSSLNWVQNVTTQLNSDFNNNITNSLNNATTNLQKMVSDRIKNATNLVTWLMSNLTNNVTATTANISTLGSLVTSMKEKPQKIIDRATALENRYGGQIERLKNDVIALEDSLNNDSDQFEGLVSSTFDSSKSGTNDQSVFAYQIRALTDQISTVSANASAQYTSAISSINQTIASTNSTLNGQSSSYLSFIQTHHDDAQNNVTSAVSNSMRYMNSSLARLNNSVATIRDTLLSTWSDSQDVESRLSNLTGQVNQLENSLSRQTVVDRLTSEMSNYGNQFNASMSQLLSDAQTAVTNALAQQNQTQLLAANVALNGSTTISQLTANLTTVVNGISTQVQAQADSVAAGTSSAQSTMTAISNNATGVYNLTSSQIADIITKYKQTSGATQKALSDQLAANGQAEASVADAVEIWENLKTTVMNLSQDETDDLSTLRSKVLSDIDSEISTASQNSADSMNGFQSTLNGIESSVNSTQLSNQQLVDAMRDQLDSIASDAASVNSDYQSQVAGLRGYVASATQQLKNRYNAILALGTPFKTAIETAATNDIAGIIGTGAGTR